MVVEENPIKFGFNHSLASPTVVAAQTAYYDLPEVSNPHLDKYALAVDLGEAGSFTQFDQAGSRFTFSPYASDVGDYTITVTLTNMDKPSESQVFEFKVTVTGQTFSDRESQVEYEK